MLIRQFAILFLIHTLGSSLSGQNWVRSNAIPVTDSGDTLFSAWAGGMQSPQFSEIDLDNDGRRDIFTLDRQDNRLLPFVRVDSGLNGLIFSPEYIDNFPSNLKNWCLSADFNGDGLMDLFGATEQGSNVHVYKNVSIPGQPLQFVLYASKLFSLYPPFLSLYVSASDLPSIYDVDQDGDLDILTFNLGGSMVEWHKNQSRELYGHSDSLVFEVESRCFGHFQESIAGCVASIGLAPCGPGERSIPSPNEIVSGPAVHVGSTLLALALDQDSLVDLIVGDVGCNETYALYNGGTLQIAHFDSIETSFPALQGPIDVRSFPAVFNIDLNEDGAKDLVSAPNSTSGSEDQTGIQWHQNIGSSTNPLFLDLGYGIFQSDMIEMGTSAYPAFVDLDQDGKLDILVGCLGKYDSAGNMSPRMAFLRNTGTTTSPAFSLEDKDYLGFGNGSSPQVPGLSPATGDLDFDGDQDLVLGNQDGTLIYFQNNAPSGSMAQFVLQSTNWQGIDVGLNSAPYLYDWDTDGKLDLLVGNAKGRIAYFRNIGTAQSPTLVLVTDTLGQIKINDESGLSFTNGFARPTLADVDSDAQDELVVGTTTGELQVYEVSGLHPLAAFPRQANFAGIDFGSFSAPAGAAINNHGLTMLVGTMRGGIELVQRPQAVSSTEPLTGNGRSFQAQCVPNPFSFQLEINASGLSAAAQAWIVDIHGRTIWSSILKHPRTVVLTGDWPSGLYHLVAHHKEDVQSVRLLKLD